VSMDELAEAPSARVPRQLPATVSNFTGRGAELAALTSMASQPAGITPTVRISAIAGSPGVGKTATAVHWAAMSSSSFPDGQLYVNLRGYDPGEPLAPADALAGFLRALGLDGKDVPADPDERAACFRSLTASRKMLVLLDNARSVEQVRPLLPGGHDCAVIVTSRDALAGLVAVERAFQLLPERRGLKLTVGQYQQATRYLHQALVHFRQSGCRAEEVHALVDLSTIDRDSGRLNQARGSLEQALRLFEDVGDDVGKSYALNHLGALYLKEHIHESAIAHYRQALALHRHNADVAGE